jgi:1-acyl-sn-glycerol-3-phosphate acyltransferase
MFMYYLLRFWLGNAVRLWYKKVYFSYEAPLPENAAIIFACTHPNSVIDYCFIPLVTRKKTYVLVRADVFSKSWIAKVLRSIWMIPVYRMRDGYSNLNLNEDSFIECHKLFDRKGRVLIFSEGISVQEKMLQPLKKGTARLALDYINHGSEKEVYIVPVANNYSKFRKFRATVMTNFGTPIKASGYRKLYEENPNLAYVKLNQDISNSLARNFIQVEKFADDCFVEKVLDVLRLDRLDDRKDWLIEDSTIFREEKSLVDRVNQIGESGFDSGFRKKLNELQISDKQEGMLKMNKHPLIQLGVLIFMSAFVGLANIFHFIPKRLTDWLIRTKIKDQLFENTVVVIGGGAIYMIQMLLIYTLLTSLFGWSGFVFASSILALSFIYIAVIDEYRFAKYNWKRLKSIEEVRQLYEGLKGF